jgi:hypothetical protein
MNDNFPKQRAMRRRTTALLGALLLALATTAPAFPGKPIRLMAGFAPS